MPESVELVVNGRRYGGWKSVRVTRSIESLAGSFALDVSDRWGAQSKPWPIVEEDECRVAINGTVVIDGYIDKRELAASASSRTLSYTGRDRAAALVDCSLDLTEWTYNKLTLADFAATIAEPFGVGVSVQPGLTLPEIRKIAVSPGDTAYEAIRRAAGDQGVMLVSDDAGGILITRAGSARATALIERENILAASVDYDGADRFRRYIVATQMAGTDEAFGNDARGVRAEAIDEGVRRTDRVLLIRPDKGYTVADARRRADWEARIRAARAETVTILVQGWTQPSGALWPLNALTSVHAPRTIGVGGDMLISQVEFSIGEPGQVTQLRLVRPDAFTPEPTVAKVKPSKVKASGTWDEIKTGGL